MKLLGLIAMLSFQSESELSKNAHLCGGRSPVKVQCYLLPWHLKQRGKVRCSFLLCFVHKLFQQCNPHYHGGRDCYCWSLSKEGPSSLLDHGLIQRRQPHSPLGTRGTPPSWCCKTSHLQPRFLSSRSYLSHAFLWGMVFFLLRLWVYTSNKLLSISLI